MSYTTPLKLDDVYFDYNYFVSSALEDASRRVNALLSLHDWLSTSSGRKFSEQLTNVSALYQLISRLTGVFHTIASLLQRIGITLLLSLIAILVGVPLWILSPSLAAFYAHNPFIAIATLATLGVGFFTAIRKLGNERDILVAFRDKVQQLSPTYDHWKFSNRNEYLAEMDTPEGNERQMKINELHEFAKV